MREVSNMQKTEQKTEQQAGLGMSFCEEEGRITVFRKTLEALEWPSHYRFLYNRKMKQIAVQACGAEESGAHRVGKPDESNSGEIKCMALVRMIYGDSGWDKKMSYRLIGRAFPQQRLATVYKGNIIKNLIMDCQSYTKYRPNETTGGIFVSWRRKEELPTGA